MSRYRKIEVRTWSDEKFRALSPIPPSGQGLWFFLLTGPHTGPIPGLFRAGRAALAEELGWDLEAFDKAFREVSRQGMVVADFESRLVWLPNAIKYNKPESPNVVRSWRSEFDLLPECPLKDQALLAMKSFVDALGEGYAKAFREAFGEALAKASAKTMANQEQEQEQEQEKEECVDSARDSVSDPTVDPAPPELPPKPEGLMAAALRKHGVDVTSMHPTLLAWVKDGYSTDQVLEAVELARVKKPKPERIPANYLDAIVRQPRARPASRASPARVPRAGNLQNVDYHRGVNPDGSF